MTLPSPLISRSPEILSGAAVFAGTRVPVQTLLDYLEELSRLDDLLADFPTVSRAHAIAVLELAKEAMTESAASRTCPVTKNCKFRASFDQPLLIVGTPRCPAGTKWPDEVACIVLTHLA